MVLRSRGNSRSVLSGYFGRAALYLGLLWAGLVGVLCISCTPTDPFQDDRRSDDIQNRSTTVTLFLTSSSTVTEDGPQNLFYVFRRTGDVTNPLTVNFTVGGSATVGSDYVQRGATTFGATTGSVTFREGSEVVIFPIDPSSDTVRDGNETVALTLTPGTGYTLGTTGAVSGTIVDNDVAPGTVVRAGVAEIRDDLTKFPTIFQWFQTLFQPANMQRMRASISKSELNEVRNCCAFAALKSDGSVVTWGNSGYGGDSSSVSSSLTSGVTQIFSNDRAFAALKSDGSVVTWGDSIWGGDSSVADYDRYSIDPSWVYGDVSSSLSSGVTQIFSTDGAFAALKSDGSVVTWGDSRTGGDSSSVSSSLTSGVTQIFSTSFAFDGAFAALKSDGSVVTWGSSFDGGDSSSVSSSLTSGVTQIFSTGSAFAALKSDGSVVTWGGGGGDSSDASSSLTSDVTQIFSSNSAFAALKSDGSVVTWGGGGGDSRSVRNRLSSGVVSFADPFTDDRLVPVSSTPRPNY